LASFCRRAGVRYEVGDFPFRTLIRFSPISSAGLSGGNCRRACFPLLIPGPEVDDIFLFFLPQMVVPRAVPWLFLWPTPEVTGLYLHYEQGSLFFFPPPFFFLSLLHCADCLPYRYLRGAAPPPFQHVVQNRGQDIQDRDAFSFSGTVA